MMYFYTFLINKYAHLFSIVRNTYIPTVTISEIHDSVGSDNSIRHSRPSPSYTHCTIVDSNDCIDDWSIGSC